METAKTPRATVRFACEPSKVERIECMNERIDEGKLIAKLVLLISDVDM